MIFSVSGKEKRFDASLQVAMHTALNAVYVPWQRFNKRKGKKDFIQRVTYLRLRIVL